METTKNIFIWSQTSRINVVEFSVSKLVVLVILTLSHSPALGHFSRHTYCMLGFVKFLFKSQPLYSISGRTSSISHEILGFDSEGNSVDYSNQGTAENICENSSKLITFIDLAGHQKYLRTTISALTGYCPHYVMLVVSATAGVVGMTQGK